MFHFGEAEFFKVKNDVQITFLGKKLSGEAS